MRDSGASPGPLSFRLAGDVEKSFDKVSDNGEGLKGRRCRGGEGEAKQDLDRSRTVRDELCLIAEGFLAA